MNAAVPSVSPLLSQREAGLLTLTLNRPSVRNALNEELMDALLVALQQAATDPAVRAVLLQGSGPSFCVGGDVKAMASARPASRQTALEAMLRHTEIPRLLHNMPKPTMALVRGSAAGAGFSLALACDLRFSTPTSKWVTAFAKVGLSGDMGGSYFLSQIVGSAQARALYFLSPVLTGVQAQAMGLVHEVFDEASIDAEVHQRALALAEGPSHAIAAMKANLNQAVSSPLQELLHAEAEGNA
jgi:2-(1,2-epoxy-1,2-dihydrophenyl)acetyl-CoA isomerase